MNIFIIYSRNNLDMVNKIKCKLQKGTNANVRFLSNYKKYELPICWHKKSRELIDESDMILYFIGKNSSNSKNINDELKYAKKKGKSIVCYISEDAPDNIKDSWKNDKSFIDENGNLLLNKALYNKIKSLKKWSFNPKKVISSTDDLIKEIKKYESNDYVNLLNNIKDANDEKLFEQYKFFAKTSEDLLTRRQAANSFYLSANVAIITIAGTMLSIESLNMKFRALFCLITCIIGLIINRSWHQILESYGINNSSKMVILQMIEKKLPASLFDAEWNVMDRPYKKEPYVSFTKSEIKLVKAFRFFYCVAGIIPLLYCMYKFLIVSVLEFFALKG
ncbi:MAG: hypothetical protein MJ147_10580 [Clostridia bacterium]|nr:hypothetical protein [Clostridia bacterium]